MTDEQFEELTNLLKDIKRILNAQRFPVEKPDQVGPYDLPTFPSPPISKCPQCGIELNGVMGYSCSRTDCPVFPQITC